LVDTPSMRIKPMWNHAPVKSKTK